MVNNIKELKELIEDFPDDMAICGLDVAGEKVPVIIFKSSYKEDGLDIPEELLISLD